MKLSCLDGIRIAAFPQRSWDIPVMLFPLVAIQNGVGEKDLFRHFRPSRVLNFPAVPLRTKHLVKEFACLLCGEAVSYAYSG